MLVGNRPADRSLNPDLLPEVVVIRRHDVHFHQDLYVPIRSGIRESVKQTDPSIMIGTLCSRGKMSPAQTRRHVWQIM